MAAKKNPNQLASTTLRDFHDFDESSFAAIKEHWQSPPSLEPLMLPERPERPYSKELFDLVLSAGGENGYAPHRSCYKKLKAALKNENERLGQKEAWQLWKILTFEGKFSTFESPHRFANEIESATNFELTVEEASETLQRLRREFDTVYHHTYFDSQEVLAGVLTLLIGPLETYKLWIQIAPQSTRGNIFPLLTPARSEKEEAEFQALLTQHKNSASASALATHDAGMLARCPDVKFAKMMCANANGMVRASGQAEKIYHLAGEPEKYAEWLRDKSSYHGLNQQELETILALISSYRLLESLPTDLSKISGIRDRKAAFKLLHHVHTKHMTPQMLALYDDKKLGKEAESWLLHEGANAIVPLTQLANNKTKKGKLATELLRRIRDMGHGDLIAELVKDADPNVLRHLNKHVLEHFTAKKEEVKSTNHPEWFIAWSKNKTLKKKKLPPFLEIESLPQLQTAQRTLLTAEDVEVFVRTLKEAFASPEDAKTKDAIEAFRTWLDPWSVAEFLHALFEGWTRAGSHKNYIWMLQSLALFGTQYTPMILKPHIKKWGKRSGNDRITTALDVLVSLWRDRGLATALDMIINISITGNYNIQRQVKPVLQAILSSTNLTLPELEDAAIPTLGFNTRGERIFDYGTRQFVLKLNEEFNPVFVDTTTDKVTTSLPRVKKSDDPETAELARAEYARDKKLIKATLGMQSGRFEEALKTNRTWQKEQWQTHLLEHTLMKNFAARLLWYDNHAKTAFRVTEDFTLANIEEEEFTLSPRSTISLAHPAIFSTKELRQWTSIFADYEIIQPISQLSQKLPPLPQNLSVVKSLEIFEDVEFVNPWSVHQALSDWLPFAIDGLYLSSKLRYKVFKKAKKVGVLTFSPKLDNNDPSTFDKIRCTSLRFFDLATFCRLNHLNIPRGVNFVEDVCERSLKFPPALTLDAVPRILLHEESVKILDANGEWY